MKITNEKKNKNETRTKKQLVWLNEGAHPF